MRQKSQHSFPLDLIVKVATMFVDSPVTPSSEQQPSLKELRSAVRTHITRIFWRTVVGPANLDMCLHRRFVTQNLTGFILQKLTRNQGCL